MIGIDNQNSTTILYNEETPKMDKRYTKLVDGNKAEHEVHFDDFPQVEAAERKSGFDHDKPVYLGARVLHGVYYNF